MWQFIEQFVTYNGYVLFHVCTYALFMIILLNVAVKWVAFMLHIQVVPSSNLSSGIICIYAASSSYESCGRIVPQIRASPLPPTYFLIHYAIIIPEFDAVYFELVTA